MMSHIVKLHSTIRMARTTGTQAVARTFALLRAFDDQHRQWQLTALARAMGMARPTTLRLLGALEREGMVERTAVGAYRLGPGAIRLGALAQRATDLPDAARPELVALAQATGETASLEILVGHEIMVIAETRGPQRGSWAEVVGGRWPAHAAATGKLLLADARAHDQGWREFVALCRGKLPRYTGRTIVSLARLQAELDRVRAEGVSTAIEELEPGYSAVAAPVHNPVGRVVAAICLGGASSRLTLRRMPSLKREVRATAERISLRLGGEPPAGRNSA